MSAETWWNERRVVYAIDVLEGEWSGHIKIGSSQRPRKRFRELAGYFQSPVRVIWAAFGSRLLESELHDLFDDLAVGGELFRGSDEMRDWFAVLHRDLPVEEIRLRPTKRRGACPYLSGPRSKWTKRATEACDG